MYYPTLPYPTLPYPYPYLSLPTPPYPIPYPTLPYPTLPYPTPSPHHTATLPCPPVLPYPSPCPTIHYPTLHLKYLFAIFPFNNGLEQQIYLGLTFSLWVLNATGDWAAGGMRASQGTFSSWFSVKFWRVCVVGLQFCPFCKVHF